MKQIYSLTKMLKSLISTTLAATAITASASVTITEIMPSNIATTVSDKFDYNGYVEFYNDGEPINLFSWFVKNTKEGKFNWNYEMGKAHILPTGYSLMFFGKEETSSETAKKVHPLYVGSIPKIDRRRRFSCFLQCQWRFYHIFVSCTIPSRLLFKRGLYGAYSRSEKRSRI